MRHRARVASLLLALVGTYSALYAVAPNEFRQLGLDFWNHARMVAWARAEEARDRDLGAEMDLQRRRDAAFDQIASDVCERRLSVRDAIGELTAYAEGAPRWWAGVRNQYRFLGIPLSATDREAATHLLRNRIESIRSCAERAGDGERAARATERLACLDDEARNWSSEEAVARAKP